METSENTSATLLGKLVRQPTDAAAWTEFVQRYRPRIYAYCLAFPLQAADAEDVTQMVLLKLVDKLRCYRREPGQRFRNWLKTVTRNVLCDSHAARRRHGGSGGSDILRLLENVEAREGLVQQLEAEFDQELLDKALRHIQPRVPPPQWEAFRLTALEGLPGVEAAARLDMPITTVYAGKSKVQKLVREEIQRLENQTG